MSNQIMSFNIEQSGMKVPTGNSTFQPQGAPNNPFRFRQGHQPPRKGDMRWPIFRKGK